MNHANFQLVTVVCEPILAERLTALVKSMGATGFTVSDVRGEGSSEKSSGEVPFEKIKIEVIAEKQLAQEIKNEIARLYFQNYSLIVYSTEIQILRPGKF